jgi:hypothetical protein
MGDKTSAFAKGGLGCLGVVIAVGILVAIVGGNFHIDLGGAYCIFAIGGVIGLIVLAIYRSGQKDSDRFD